MLRYLLKGIKDVVRHVVLDHTLRDQHLKTWLLQCLCYNVGLTKHSPWLEELSTRRKVVHCVILNRQNGPQLVWHQKWLKKWSISSSETWSKSRLSAQTAWYTGAFPRFLPMYIVIDQYHHRPTPPHLQKKGHRFFGWWRTMCIIRPGG